MIVYLLEDGRLNHLAPLFPKHYNLLPLTYHQKMSLSVLFSIHVYLVCVYLVFIWCV